MYRVAKKAVTRIGQLIELLKDIWNEKSSELDQISDEAAEMQESLFAAPGTIGWDLVCFRVEQLLRDRLGLSWDELKNWEQLWASTTKIRGDLTSRIYDPPGAYYLFLQAPDRFEHLIRIYRELLNQSETAVVEDFLKAFFRIRADLTPRLTARELDVFRLALEQQTLSPTKLARQLGMTKGYVSRVINSLKERVILWERVRFSFKALGLQVLIALVELTSLDAELPPAFSANNPWLYSLFESRMGSHFAIAHFVVPDSWRSQSEARNWVRKLSELDDVRFVNVFNRIEPMNWMHFNYNMFNGVTWEVQTGIFSPMMRSGFTREIDDMSQQSLESDLERTLLDETDIQIISHLTSKGPLTLRELRNILKKDYNFVVERHNRLREHNVIINRVIPTPLFAPGVIVVMTKIPHKLHLQLCNAVSCLPEVYAERTVEGYTSLVLRVPEEHVRDIVEDLNDFLRGRKRWITYLGDMHFIKWKLPVHRWLDGYKDWWISDVDFEVGT